MNISLVETRGSHSRATLICGGAVSQASLDLGMSAPSVPAFWQEGESTVIDPSAMIVGLGYFITIGERPMVVVKNEAGDVDYYFVLDPDEGT